MGEVAAEISLARCFGEGTDCGPGTIEPLAAPPDDSQACELEAEGVARIAWQTDLDSRSVPCELGACRVSGFRAARAPDGSLWATGMVTTMAQDDNAAGVFLGHYGAAGEVLSEAVIALDVAPRGSSVWYAPFVTVDSRGHVFVSAYEHVRLSETESEEHVWLAEYDAGGQAVGDPVPVLEREGIAQLATAGDQGVVLNVSPFGDHVIDPAVLARVMPGGELQFAQIAMRETRVTSIVSDAAGRTAAIGQVRGLVRSSDSYGLSSYDEQGNLVWTRDLLPQCVDPALIGDRNGDLVRVGCPAPDPLPHLAASHVQVEKLNAIGDRIWARHVDVPANDYPFAGETSAAVDDENNIYIPTMRWTTNGFLPTLHRLSSDGESCRVFVLDDERFTGPAPANHMTGGILAGASDELYVVTTAGIARLQL